MGRTLAVVVVRLAAVMAREKVAVGETFTATPVSPAAGVVAVTVGGGCAVKVHVAAEVMLTPSAEAAPVEICAT